MNTYILLYKRWFKNRQRLIRATLIGVVALFLTTYYVLLNTFSLDVSQKTMIRLGESDYSTAIKVVSPGSKIPAKEIYKAIESGGAHPDSLRIQG